MSEKPFEDKRFSLLLQNIRDKEKKSDMIDTRLPKATVQAALGPLALDNAKALDREDKVSVYQTHFWFSDLPPK